MADDISHRMIVKAFHTKMFEVELVQDRYNRYCIRWKTSVKDEQSEWINDFSTASYMFDLKIRDLEGH